MELRTFQIDLDSLEEINTQQVPFDLDTKQADLEYFARSIIKLGGLLRIPVVERTGIDSYRLIEGHFDYLAYLKARNIDPDLPDRIRVFILDKDNSEPVQTQLKVLRNLDLPAAKIAKESSSDNDAYGQENFQNIYKQIDSLKLFMETEFKKLENKFAPLYQFISSKDDLTSTRQVLDELKLEISELRKIAYPQKINLLSANQGEIYDALVESGIQSNYAQAALEAIEYWKHVEQELTWANLQKSVNGKKQKIQGFGKATFLRLREISEIKHSR